MAKLVFDPFRLDLDGAQLWRGETPVVLRPKVWATLQFLVASSGRLVRKDELLDAVWPDTSVTEEMAAQTIRELRRALGDSSQAPRFIEVVHGRGFRWIAATTLSESHASPANDAIANLSRPATTTSPFVGRERELRMLEDALHRATAGTRQVVFLTGETGIGKTTLLQMFRDEVEGRSPAPLVAAGTCIENFGAGEPLMPVLDALSRMQRGPSVDLVRSALCRLAPAWLQHLPGFAVDGSEAALSGRGAASLRQLAEALETIAADRTLVLLIEDAHWSDHSSVDLLSQLARRADPARLLILCTYRPVDAALQEHPIRALHRDLDLRALCQSISLDYLDKPAVHQYLALRCPGAELPDSFLQWMHRRTDGSPLFLSNLFDTLLGDGFLRREESGWLLREDFETVGIPERLEALVRHQQNRLSAEDLAVIEAAGIAGIEFSAALVAASLDLDEVECARRLHRLSERDQFIARAGIWEYPDGRTSDRFRFLHGVYQEVVAGALPRAQRARFHVRMGDWLEVAHGSFAGRVAAEIAMHLEEGGEHARAIAHWSAAATTAMQRGGYADAVKLLRHALDLMARQPALDFERELALRTALATALIFTAGRGTTAREETERARDLSEQQAGHRQKFLSLWVAKNLQMFRGENQELDHLTVKLLEVAREAQDVRFLLLAQNARAMFFLLGGRLGEAEIAAPDLSRVPTDYDWQDPEVPTPAHVTALFQGGILTWLRGRESTSGTLMDDAMREARRTERSIPIFYALTMAALGSYFRGDRDTVSAFAVELRANQDSTPAGRGNPLPGAFALWATPEPFANSVAADLVAAVDAGKPDFLGATWVASMLTETFTRMGDSSTALAVAEAGLQRAQRSGERLVEPELLRLSGESLWKVNPLEAERRFEQAIALARSQGALAWELRSTISLVTHLVERGDHETPRRLLLPLLERFPEASGHDDVRVARQMVG